MRDLNILFSSAGRRVALSRCFRRDAAALGIKLQVLATDMDPDWSAACQDADHSFAVPRCDDPGFIPRMLEICGDHQVDLIVPTIDNELEAYAGHIEAFASCGTVISVSNPGLIAIARDKLETARHLQAHKLPTPLTMTPEEVRADPGAITWPVFAKPRGGSSSKGIFVAGDLQAIAHLDRSTPYIIQEKLGGVEYTINMYFDRDGTVRCVVPHLRRQTRAGEVEKGITVRHPALEEAGWALGRSLPGGRGVICFQAFVDDEGSTRIFEINGRFGGGFPLAHAAGATFSRWLLQEVSGMVPDWHNDWHDSCRMLRFDDAVFL